MTSDIVRRVIWVAGALLFVSLRCAAAEGDRWRQWEMNTNGGAALAGDLGAEGWTAIAPGDPFRAGDQGAWLRASVEIPLRVGESDTAGRPLGLQINSDNGGEIYVNGSLQARYDNDHAGLALLSRRARPGERVHVAVRVFRSISAPNSEQKLGQSDFVIVEKERAVDAARIAVDVRRASGRYPEAFLGMSQGAGMADYNDDTAAMFRAIGIKWFRMDNILTNAVKRNPDGTLAFDWSDLDRRVDFMEKIGCEFIACASYMPEALEAFPNPDRHARPKSYKEWEETCYQAARRCIERGKPIRKWEVWNEANSGWLVPSPGETGLEAYLKLYDATWKGVRRADPTAWIGGPCNASGPWERSPERNYAVNGETFMRGLLEHCEKTGAPLDFISWHEYFHPPEIICEEASVTRRYMRDYPKAAAGVKEFMITEWNYAWWTDWPQDHELGAAWMANSIMRAMLPAKIDKPCFFYAKDGDDTFRGGWGMLMGPNRPKPVYNAARLFSMMASTKVPCSLDDPELAVLAGTDTRSGRTTVLLLNYAERYGVERRVTLSIEGLPDAMAGGMARRWVVDKEHSNVFHSKDRAALECLSVQPLSGSSHSVDLALPTNSLTLIELTPAKER